MGSVDDLQREVRVIDRLEGDPCIYASFVKTFQGRHPIGREGRVRLPLQRDLRSERGQGRGERVAAGPEQVEVPERASAALGQSREPEAVLFQNLDGLPGQPVLDVYMVVWVCREAHHNLLSNSEGLILHGVFSKPGQKVFPRLWVVIEV